MTHVLNLEHIDKIRQYAAALVMDTSLEVGQNKYPGRNPAPLAKALEVGNLVADVSLITFVHPAHAGRLAELHGMVTTYNVSMKERLNGNTVPTVSNYLGGFVAALGTDLKGCADEFSERFRAVAKRNQKRGNPKG